MALLGRFHGGPTFIASHPYGTVTHLESELQGALRPAYSIERELGGGGMSRVFVATEIALVRQASPHLLSSARAIRSARRAEQGDGVLRPVRRTMEER